MIAAARSTHSAPTAIPDPAGRLAVALDFPTAHQALAFVDSLEGSCRWMKVGLELYCAAGNSLIETLRNRGMNVFLDLKLHDIPNTVAGAIRTVTSAGASLLTIHATGGEAMLRAAAEAAAENVNSPRLLAVTVLTSMDAPQLTGIGIHDTPAAQVLRLAHLATTSGIDGLVCSAEEIAPIRQHLGPTPYLVVPGIRPTGTPVGDQRRVATPAEAIQSGASLLVVGRPITQSPHPAKTARAILAEIAAS